MSIISKLQAIVQFQQIIKIKQILTDMVISKSVLQFTFAMLSLITLNLSFGCKTENPADSKLIANWHLVSGQRNNIEQNSLEGIVFNFTRDSITTNFNVTGVLETNPYQLKDKKIIQLGKTKQIYQLIDQTDSILTLYTELRGSDFRLNLAK